MNYLLNLIIRNNIFDNMYFSKYFMTLYYKCCCMLMCIQEDKLWDWDKLFAEMSGDIKEVWSRISDRNVMMTKSNSGTSESGIYLPGKAT